jgi:nucleobase:cation symporter-1, NCS1 family
MCADYFIVRRFKGIDLKACYEPHGVYWFTYGVNLRAMAALILAIAPNLPGLLYSMGVPVHNRGILNYFSATWLTGTLLAAVSYTLLNYIFPPAPVTGLSQYHFDEKGILNMEILYLDGGFSTPASEIVVLDEKKTVQIPTGVV